MEHIQCPHCKKKYGANEKIKAAEGKKIRCKHCQEIFSIVIRKTSEIADGQQPRAENSAPEIAEAELQQPPAATIQNEGQEEAAEKKETAPEKKTVKKKPLQKRAFNVQLMITIVLAAILFIGGITALLYFNNPELFKPGPKKESSAITLPAIPNIDPFAKPAIPEQAGHAAEETAAETPPLEEAIAEPTEAGPPKPTQVCKDAAADHWIRTHKLAHRQMSSEAYMKLFNQGIDQTAEVRKLCTDKSLVARLTVAAQKEIIPDWIRTEIETRTAVDNARRKQMDSHGH